MNKKTSSKKEVKTIEKDLSKSTTAKKLSTTKAGRHTSTQFLGKKSIYPNFRVI